MTRYLFGKCWTLFAVVTIIAAVLLTFVRLLLPYASLYQEEIQQWLSKALDQPLQIGSLAAEWHGLGPQLTFYDIDFLDRDSGGIRASLMQAGISVDVWASLLNGELRFGSLTVTGVSLSVLRHRDGSITVAGLGATENDDPVKPDSSSALLAWLFSQERLALENSSIAWYDEALSQKELRFVNVNLELRNDGDRHQFDGSASLPDDLGRRLSFAVDLQGDIFVAGGWGGTAYLNGRGIQIAPLLNWLPLAGLRVDEGIAELRLWSEWKESRLQSLEGELAAFGMVLSSQPSEDPLPSAKEEYLDALSGRFSWQRKATGWQLDVERFVLGRWGDFWPQGSYHLDWTEPGAADAEAGDMTAIATGLKGSSRLQLWADYIRTEDVAALLLLTDLPLEAGRDLILSLQPAGELHQLHVQWWPDAGHVAVDSTFSDLSIQPWRKLPGVSGLSGHLVANERQGQISLASRELHVEYKPLFRQALSIDTLEGALQWRIDSDGWHGSGRNISLSTADIKMAATIDMTIPSRGGSPIIDLVLGFMSEANGLSNTSAYLPVGIMSKDVVRWLDQAMVDGQIVSGGLILHGPLRRFPFDRAEGRFETRLLVEAGILDYAPGWPRIEGLEAEVLFSGRHMAINSVAGQVLGAELKSVNVSISNMTANPAVLILQGEATGDTSEALRFIRQSPLRQRFGQFVDGVKAKGRSQVALDLQLPLAKKGEVSINGSLRLEDSELLLADGAVELTRLNGRLEFSSAGLSADDIQGRVMGLDAHFSVLTSDINNSTVTTVLVQGNASIEEMRTIVDPPLFDRFTGRADWQARLRVPGDGGAAASLMVSSDLRGLASNLPAPVDKPADQSLSTVVEMHLPLSLDRPLTIQVGDDLSVTLDLDAQLQMERGEIRFADGPAQMPTQAGIRLAGIVPAFSFTEWFPFFEEEEVNDDESAATGVNRVVIDVADIELYRHHFNNARVDATLTGNTWQAFIDSKQVKGSVQVPLDNVIPLVLDLEHLYLSTGTGDETDEDEDPRQLPPMRIQSKSLHIDDIDFGSLSLTASRMPAGLHLTNLRLQSSLMDIKARGDWLVANNEHYSSFNISFTSPNVGKALSRFGYADSIKGGKGRFTINARWPGAPLSFALAHLDGNINIAIDDGHLLEVDPGVGRVFGLLSLQTLPRRLILDFRDVFSKGFAFDHIGGDFNVHNGQAETSNLTMKGPAAKISVEGRIGLVERDYDQRVTVIPDVAGTVPLLTAIMQGPLVGGAVLLLKKLLKPKIDKAATIRYSVTGSWDNPVIERLPD